MEDGLVAQVLMGGLLVIVGLTMVVLAIWLHARKQEQAHIERMKALELGQLPEVLRATAEMSRTRAAGTVGVLVPLTMAGTAAGGTALVLYHDWLHRPQALLLTIWGVCGLVALVAVACSLGALRRGGRKPPTGTPLPTRPGEQGSDGLAHPESKPASSVTV